jgi:hypothetical protein
MTSTTDQQRPQAWAEEIRTCLLSGPGRGDCEHFVGWPDIEDESTTDVWGVPFGWCIVCYWRHHALAAQATVARQGKEIERLQASLTEIVELELEGDASLNDAIAIAQEALEAGE